MGNFKERLDKGIIPSLLVRGTFYRLNGGKSVYEYMGVDANGISVFSRILDFGKANPYDNASPAVTFDAADMDRLKIELAHIVLSANGNTVVVQPYENLGIELDQESGVNKVF